VLEHWRPAQHWALLVQFAPPCKHATHCPATQSSPWQQSAAELHEPPLSEQHCPASPSQLLLQQSRGLPHAPPTARQTAGWQDCCRHVQVLQQSDAVVHGPA
jgi:hypothetical protein